MPIKNNQYVPSNRYKRMMKKYIGAYLCSKSGGCKLKEFLQLLVKLRTIENDFYRENKSLNIEQNLTFQQNKNREATAMKNYAIPQIYQLLDELYKQRHGELKKLKKKKFTRKTYNNVAKKIWRERCNERERCPRCGIILLFCDKPGDEQVLLTEYFKDGCSIYGHSKGKIEFYETIPTCSAREPMEELNLNSNNVYDLIEGRDPIHKNVPYNLDGSTIHVDHYYFIIADSFENWHFNPNKSEIDDVKYHSIYTLPCCRYCQESPLVKYDDEPDEHPDYYMTTCANFTVKSSLVWDIVKYVDDRNGSTTASKKYEDLHRHCQRKD